MKNHNQCKFNAKSIALTSMSVIRAWGGGECYPQIFYDKCDELSVLLCHDVMDAKQECHNLVVSLDSGIEITHDIRSFFIMLELCYTTLAMRTMLMTKEVIKLMKKYALIL